MTFCRSRFVFIHIVGSTFIFNIFFGGATPRVGCFRWKTVKRAAALRENFIVLLAYIHEPYSSRSKLFLAGSHGQRISVGSSYNDKPTFNSQDELAVATSGSQDLRRRSNW